MLQLMLQKYEKILGVMKSRNIFNVFKIIFDVQQNKPLSKMSWEKTIISGSYSLVIFMYRAPKADIFYYTRIAVRGDKEIK